ncbi:hypothetical protein EVA_19794 [gut metagenome]|uniref:dATP/dGTP diphosphohydrolase N-terminal domain-containing protein n=1 Tax=gut metagenome TaxID=749906 RepID=J9FCF1_9ZZZZ
METESKKNDRKDGKLMWELLPLEMLEDVVRVYTFGAKKYGPNTWKDLPDGLQRYKAALLRHLVEFEKGHILDDESHIEHLAHVIWNAIAMLTVSKNDKTTQDRLHDELMKLRQQGQLATDPGKGGLPCEE